MYCVNILNQNSSCGSDKVPTTLVTCLIFRTERRYLAKNNVKVKVCFIVQVHVAFKVVHVHSAQITGKIIQIENNRISNLNWQGATSWLFTSVTEDFNSGRPTTNPGSGRGVACGHRRISGRHFSPG